MQESEYKNKANHGLKALLSWRRDVIKLKAQNKKKHKTFAEEGYVAMHFSVGVN